MTTETRDESIEDTTPIRIAKFTVQNFKKVRFVTITPASKGLTVFAGGNCAGKTSLLDALGHALVGPSAISRGAKLINDNAEEIPGMRGTKSVTTVELSNGMLVERRLTDKNSRTGNLTITLPSGVEGSIEDLKRYLSPIALTPFNMGDMSERERLKHLLGAVNVDLSDLEQMLEDVTKEKESLYIAKEKAQKHANDLPEFPGVPTTEVKASDITSKLQQAMTANSANIAKRQEVDQIKAKANSMKTVVDQRRTRVAEIEAQLVYARQECVAAEAELKTLENDVAEASKKEIPDDIPLDALQKKLEDIDALNRQIRQNITKKEKIDEAAKVRAEWNSKTQEQTDILAEMKSRVTSANLPLSEIGIDDDLKVTFAGRDWYSLSGMQRLVMQTAIASMYQPLAEFVFADGLETLDAKSQANFHKWAASKNLQVFCTEVRDHFDGDSGDTRAQFIIKDGEVA